MFIGTPPYQRRPAASRKPKSDRVVLRFTVPRETILWLVDEAALRSWAERRHVEVSEIARECLNTTMEAIKASRRADRAIYHWDAATGKVRPLSQDHLWG